MTESNLGNVTVSLPTAPPDLESASAEVKRYQREKLWSGLASLALTLAVLAFFALWAAPRLDPWLSGFVGTRLPYHLGVG